MLCFPGIPADRRCDEIHPVYGYDASGILSLTPAGEGAEPVKTALSIASSEDLIFIGGSSYVVAEAIQYWDGICDNKKVNP